ncbi:MAG: nickel pincer cofactor biosynthesis protein LarB [Acidimicrobiia bacterium]|nr:nickel pincer cofactor biosynthesis protein LarB [Acidimicrobiia bacterium]MDH5237249.1 nickel pincer cofactor biosynthesis protein LarB [Acidimicrobiia bacterium]
MDETTLRNLLADIRTGAVDPDDAVRQIRALPFADLGHTKVDHHRHLRQHMAEAIYGPGKTAEQCRSIVAELLASGSGPVVLTRADEQQAEAVLAEAPDGRRYGTTLVWRARSPRPESVVLVTAGTADGPVAAECGATLAANGIPPSCLHDVGVAGLHRLLADVESIQAADAVVVVAGMEGALASVVTGLTGAPVVAVPTSTGYGAGLEGITALLSMLASCASGLTVVGIDNGFGAACAVVRLLGPSS